MDPDCRYLPGDEPPQVQCRVIPEVGVDLRDIRGQWEAELEYILENTNRGCGGEASAVTWKLSEGGTKVGEWNGNTGAGKSFAGDLLSVGGFINAHEFKALVGHIEAGCVSDKDQYGAEAEATVISAEVRQALIKLKAKALSAGYTTGLGRNSSGSFIRAELASVEASVGPVSASLGIGFDMGSRVSKDGIEFKALGTGFSFDRKEGIGISILGSTLKFNPFF